MHGQCSSWPDLQSDDRPIDRPGEGAIDGQGGGGGHQAVFEGDRSRVAAGALQDFRAFGVACPWGVGLGAHGGGPEGECSRDSGGQVEGVGGPDFDAGLVAGGALGCQAGPGQAEASEGGDGDPGAGGDGGQVEVTRGGGQAGGGGQGGGAGGDAGAILFEGDRSGGVVIVIGDGHIGRR